MIAIRGAESAVAKALWPLLTRNETVVAVSRGDVPPLNVKRYLFCQGLIRSKRIEDQSAAEIAETRDVNALQVMADCDRIIAGNDRARICVIGSESAYAGSFDGAYAQAKAELHQYVKTKALRTRFQQLICIAPTVIRDAGMTLRRADLDELDKRADRHPKRRWLKAAEVARLVHFALYIDEGYLSGVVIRMNGGAHAVQQ